MKDILEELKAFASDRDWDKFHTPENLAKSVAIEASELLECYQWSNDADIDKVQEEIADVMNYCLMLCNKLELDPKEIIMNKIEKNKLKYPIDKCYGKHDKYTRYIK